MSELADELRLMADEAAGQATPYPAAEVIRRGDRRRRYRIAQQSAGCLSVFGVATAAVLLTGPPGTGHSPGTAGTTSDRASALYHFKTLVNPLHARFNRPADINNSGEIVGTVFSAPQAGSAKGYMLLPPYAPADYHSESFPGSKQTWVIGLNDNGMSAGFYSRTNLRDQSRNLTIGFWAKNGHYHQVAFPVSQEPASLRSKVQNNRIEDVNNHSQLVGTFEGRDDQEAPYLYDITTHKYHLLRISPPGAESTGYIIPEIITDKGMILGVFQTNRGLGSFLFNLATRHIRVLSVPGGNSTYATGINDRGEVVGEYSRGRITYGFIWTAADGFQTVSAPSSPHFTAFEGVNSAGDIVGYDQGSPGFQGFLATP